MTTNEKPQVVIDLLKEFKDTNAKLAELRVKRNKMIFHAHDNGYTVSTIARLFDMQQPNVTYIIVNRERYDI